MNTAVVFKLVQFIYIQIEYVIFLNIYFKIDHFWEGKISINNVGTQILSPN